MWREKALLQTLQLRSKKGEILNEKTISYLQLNKGNSDKIVTNSTLEIKHKFTCRKSVLRTRCTIENEYGETIATVYNKKNIHSGVNKINYTLTHQLNSGESIFLYVKTPAGQVVEKHEMIIPAK